MRIVYHHRTRATDAQRIHIQEMVRAFESLGHIVRVVSLVSPDAAQDDAVRDAGEARWKVAARRVPCAYELLQLAYNAVGIPLLFMAVWRRRVDFIYERYSLFNFSGVVVARLCRVPIVLEVNSPFALEQARERDIRLHGLARWTERTICRLATRVIVVSTPLARILRDAGVPAEQIEVMVNGVSLDHFRNGVASSSLRTRLGLDGQIVIGFVGWFRPWHGLDVLLEAFRRANLAGRGAKVLLIGDGEPVASELKALAAQHGLTDHVVFTGPLPHPEVPQYLDLVDIGVQPAANEYCCPMKILEYMALGKPVVAPRQENTLELLQDGHDALCFTPRDADSLAAALTELVANRERALAMGARARAAVLSRGFLWTSNARRVVAFFQPNVWSSADGPYVEGTLAPSSRR